MAALTGRSGFLRILPVFDTPVFVHPSRPVFPSCKFLWLIILWGAPIACNPGGDPSVGSGPAIVELEVRQLPFAGAPTFHALDEWFVKQLQAAGSPTGMQVRLGGSRESFARPMKLAVSWSLRPASRIRPITDGDRMLDHAIEVSVQSQLVPLFPHDPSQIRSAVSGRWITYAQADVKTFEIRLKTELEEAFTETLGLLWMETELQEMPEDGVVRLLASDNLQRRRAAVEAVRQRRIASAVTELTRLIDSDPSLSLRMSVVGVLGELGDPAGVEALAEFAMLIQPEQTVYVLSEIARIGGDDARRFLHWVAAAHRLPEVRKAAGNLLHTMLKELPVH